MGYLFWQNTKPVLEVSCDFKKKSPLCGELVPAARVAAGEDGIIVKSEPVYFDIRLPRKYDKVEAKIEYSDLAPDIFEFGVARDEAKKNFDFIAVQNKVLDNLTWQKIEGGGITLYQKKFIYKNTGELKERMPGFAETLVYRAAAPPPLSGLKSRGETKIDFSIVGGLNFFVYHQGGAIKIEIETKSDYQVKIYQDGKETGDAGNLDAGLYKVSLSGAEDAVFDRIIINSPYVVIADRIKIGHLQKPLTVYFAGSRLFANAYAAGGAQKIDANGQIINIERIQEQYTSVFKNIKLRPVEISKGEVELGAALFFINNKNIFYPRYEPFYVGADLSKINFIITGYKAPEGVEIKIGRAVFDITDTPTANRKMRFILSLPNAAEGRLVKIRSIKLEFQGGKFSFNDLFQKLMKLIHPVKST